MPRFMLIALGKPNWHEGVSPDERQRIMERYRAWSDGMRAAGRFVVSDKLMDEGGKIVSAERGKLAVVDGPYTETNEVVGGYMTIRAANYEEAVALARDHPHLDFGRLAIRKVDPMGCGEDD